MPPRNLSFSGAQGGTAGGTKRTRQVSSSVNITKDNSSKTQLLTICKTLKIPSTGTWDDLKNRIVDYLAKKPAGEINKMACLKDVLVESLTKKAAPLPDLPPPALSTAHVNALQSIQGEIPEPPEISNASTPLMDLGSLATSAGGVSPSDLMKAISELQDRLTSNEDLTKKLVVSVNHNTASIANIAQTMLPAITDTLAVRSQIEAISDRCNALMHDREEANSRTSANFTTLENELAKIVTSSNALKDSHVAEVQKSREKFDLLGEVSARTAKMTELNSRALRACNVLVLGWPVVLSPIDDAKAWLSRIDCNVDLVSAKRLPPIVKSGITYPGRLCIITAHPSVAIRLLAASRRHAAGSRDMPYFAKPDLTADRLAAKRQADEHIRALYARHPDRHFRERNGKVARFDYNGDGELVFRSWVTAPDTPPRNDGPRYPPPPPSGPELVDGNRETVVTEADADLIFSPTSSQPPAALDSAQAPPSSQIPSSSQQVEDLDPAGDAPMDTSS